jgi:hypothetical protein
LLNPARWAGKGTAVVEVADDHHLGGLRADGDAAVRLGLDQEVEGGPGRRDEPLCLGLRRGRRILRDPGEVALALIENGASGEDRRARDGAGRPGEAPHEHLGVIQGVIAKADRLADGQLADHAQEVGRAALHRLVLDGDRSHGGHLVQTAAVRRQERPGARGAGRAAWIEGDHGRDDDRGPERRPATGEGGLGFCQGVDGHDAPREDRDRRDDGEDLAVEIVGQGRGRHRGVCHRVVGLDLDIEGVRRADGQGHPTDARDPIDDEDLAAFRSGTRRTEDRAPIVEMADDHHRDRGAAASTCIQRRWELRLSDEGE